jgi:hypothetical protein
MSDINRLMLLTPEKRKLAITLILAQQQKDILEGEE